MVSRFVRVLVFLCLVVPLVALAAPPAPKEHFGYTPGDDYKLAGFDEVASYFRRLAASSDRIKLIEFGQSHEGRPLLAAFLSSAANLKRLDEFRAMNRRLALGDATPEEAAKLVAETKVFVWIDSGLHSSEVAPVQHAPHLAYQMVTGESAELQRIRENVILIQVPVINPDGHQMIVDWYRQNLGTPHEVAAMPKLYHRYAGHDNNRDWFMLNLVETRHVSRMLFQEWFPQIVYNQHQVAPFPARIFIPPYAEPLNPKIPAPLMEGINLIGSAMRERFARENKPGVISYLGFDAWWNGGLRTAPAFHNMHGILTETALYAYATPREYKAADFPARFSNGMPTLEPSVFYQQPWKGGRWSLMDAVEYSLTADFAILDLAAARREHFVRKAWEMARANIDAGRSGKPFAYLVPMDKEWQHDPWTAAEMIKRLRGSGLTVEVAAAPIAANGKTYPAGTLVLPAAQAFRGYLMDLLEPQKYPEIRAGQTGPTKRPYDLAGWTLAYQMGVRVDRVDTPGDWRTQPAGELNVPIELNPRSNSVYLKAAEMLRRNERLRYDMKTGELAAGPTAGGMAYPVSMPRVGIYQPWSPSMDAGWTEWLLDTFQIRYENVRNTDLQGGRLRNRFDTVILAQQPLEAMLHGWKQGERGASRGDWDASAAQNQPRPEHTGGMGVEGAMALLEFVRAGGTLLAFDSATELPLRLFPIGVRGVLRGGEGESGWYCPGSILRATVETAHPLAAGLPQEIFITSTGGQGFDITLLDEFNKDGREARAVVRYAQKDLLASGWLSGERVMAGKAAMVDARLGTGHVVLFGFRPQFRGQTFGTIKLVLNAIYRSAAQPVR
jgi:hypothetical protein